MSDFPTQAPRAVMPQRAAGPVCERCGAQPLDVTALLDEKASFMEPVSCPGLCRPAAWRLLGTPVPAAG